MNARLIVAAAVVALGGLAPPGAAAQEPVQVARECRDDRVWDRAPAEFEAPWDALHPRLTFERAKARVPAGGWRAAGDELLETLDVLLAAVALDSGVAARLRSELEALRADLARGTRHAESLPHGNRFAVEIDEGVAEFLDLPGDRVVLAPDDGLETVRAFCWTAIAAQRVLTLANAPARRAAVTGLSNAVRAWDRFNATGYSQYPWEVLLNAASPGLMPPSVQWIVLHPAVGIELVGDELDAMQRLDVLLLEPLGVVAYTRDRAFYVGAAGVISVPSQAPVGAGVMLHVGPYLKVGHVWRRGTTGNGVVLSVDLYRWLSGVPERFHRARDRASALAQASLERK